MADLKDYRRAIEYCTYCPKMCRFACPVAQAENRETVHPTSKMTLLHLIKEGGLEWSREVADTIYRCTGCLISRTFCEHQIEVFPPFVAAREESIRQGVAPDKVMEQDKVVEKHKNPYGENLARKLDGNVPTRLVQNDAETMFFVGCTTTQFFDKNLKATLQLLEAVGADHGVYVDDYICCTLSSKRQSMHSGYIIDDICQFFWPIVHRWRRPGCICWDGNTAIIRCCRGMDNDRYYQWY